MENSLINTSGSWEKIFPKNYGKRNYPWRMYVIVYVAVLVLYFVMNGLLTSKLKKVNLAEVLKNRE